MKQELSYLLKIIIIIIISIKIDRQIGSCINITFKKIDIEVPSVF